MAQLGLSYSAPFDGAAAWFYVLDAVRAAVNRLGVKEVAHALDVSPSTLCEALRDVKSKRKSKGAKRVAAEWLPTLLLMANDSDRLSIITALCAPIGYVPQRRRAMTPEERLAELEQRISQRFGEAGAALLREVP